MNDFDNVGYIKESMMDTELQQPTEVDYAIEYGYFRGVAPKPLYSLIHTFY